MKKTFSVLFSAILIFGVLAMSACDSGGANDTQEPEPQPPEPATFDRAAMLANIGNNIIIPSYQAFQVEVNALQQASDAFAAGPTAELLTALDDALQSAWLAWQDVAMFQIGPAETAAFRGIVNTYPTNTEQIEANILSGSYVLGSLSNIPAGGFPALDYLVNGVGETADAILAMYTTEADAASRLKYLEDNVAFIKQNTDTVVDGWDPSGGNYIATFLSDDKGGTDVGSSLGEMINAMVLHYERFIRDGKIGIPSGVRSSGVPRPKTTEAFYAGYSLDLAVASVEALSRLYQGTGFEGEEGSGLDENLQFLEATELSDDIKSTVTSIVSTLENLSDPLSAQIEADAAAVQSSFADMQELVVLLKADMTSILGITITYQDNDGD